MSTRIRVNLFSQKSIEDAIKQIKTYQKSIDDKCNEFVRRLAEVGVPVIDERMHKAQFQVAETTDNGGIIYKGANTEYSHKITVTSDGNVSTAILSVKGKDLLFIEFGAGVYYNGQAGSSPHPYGQKLGYRIGYFGKGHGKQKVWGYYDGEELILTHGVEATMPMYGAWQEMYKKIDKIAREVFSNG